MSDTPAITLSGFADEIADDFEAQLDTVEKIGLEKIELRSVNGTNLLDLSESEWQSILDQLNQRDIEVACIASPIGKIEITDEFDPHLDRFEKALNAAEFFGTDYIRMFSYWVPSNEDPATYRDEVMRRMQAKVDRAESRKVTLLHENEKDLYGDTPERCRDLMTTIDSPYLRAIFDPANFLEVGVHPYPDALLQLIEFVDYLHIKDAEFGQRGVIRIPGEGDGNISEILDTFQQRNFSGIAALEPHLAEAHEMGGHSGPEGFQKATESFRDILSEIGYKYN